MASFKDVLAPFDLTTAVVLITGASSGIGRGLVDALVKRGSRVLITGRRASGLAEVQKEYGQDKVLSCYVGDVGKEADRIDLFRRATHDHPDLNVLINNAGIQRRGDQAKEAGLPWSEREEEILINISSPIHLTSLFIPHMLALGKPSAIIEITSGLAFVPFTAGPIYSATKAALHQYTAAMRPLLANTQLRLVELIPPSVKSNLGGSHDFGEDAGEFCEYSVEQFAKGRLEFGWKFSEDARTSSREWQFERQKDLMRQNHVKGWGES